VHSSALVLGRVRAELGPVDLGLLAGRGLEAHHRLTAPLPVGIGELLEDGEAAAVAHGEDLLVERRRRELRELGEPREQVVLVGIELAGAHAWGAHRRAATAQGASHGVAADAQRAGDRLDRHTRAVQGDDVHPLLQTDQQDPLPELPRLRLSGSLTGAKGGPFQTGSRGSVSHRQ